MASIIDGNGWPFGGGFGSGRSGNNGGGRQTVTPDFSDIAAHFHKPGKVFWIIFCVVVVLLLGLWYWWVHPPINLQSPGMWTPIVWVCIIAGLILFWRFRHYRRILRNPELKVEGKKLDPAKRGRLYKYLLLIPAVILLAGIIGALTSASFFPGNAERYAGVLQTTTGTFAKDLPEVNYNQIPVIDGDSATLLGNRAMGSLADYVSQFTIDPIYSQINYHGQPVRVSPLNYADFFKWITNQSAGIPAYVVVNMTTQDTQVVRLQDLGLPPIRYSDSDPFFKNIDRYVQLKYPFYMFEQKSFELDESGVPYWICPVQSRTIGLFGGETISRVVLVNACTGECQDLPIAQVPTWVDRAYPADLLIQQYNWSGAYANGWLNSWLGQSGVKETTPGSNGDLGYNYLAKDDDVWVYSGVTSATSDNSIIGFVLIDQRTHQSNFYSVAGATEESAMNSAEGQVQNLGYKATFPLLINVNDQPTYFMALKDSAGLVKKYAMLDIQRYQNVATGDTPAATQDAYTKLLATNASSGGDSGGGAAATPAVQTKTATGQIKTITQATVDNVSKVYVVLKGDSNIYECTLPQLIDVVRFAVGDRVKISYLPGEQTCAVSAIKAAG
ncbi:MAG: Tat pathway signal sequence [Coriobacteriales bacterium]|jgi:hypothetical protein|nr:Tat pathway signal sequence [Coriobacteriales bacterium]